jgi:hypothetical protein
MAFTSVSEWSSTAASNTSLNGITLASATMTASQIDDAFRELMKQIADYTRRGSDLPSAATLNLDSIDTLDLNITGIVTVTAVTLTDTHWRMATATGAFQLTASANLIVNGSTSSNYTTTAGDILFFKGYAAGVVRVWIPTLGAVTGVPTAATAAEVWAGTASTKYVPPSIMQAALLEQTLTDGATVTVDFAAGINFKLAIGGNRALAASNLTNIIGRSGYIRVTQDATGSRTLSTTASPFVNANGVDIVLSTAANAKDIIYYHVVSATEVVLSLTRAIS